MGDLKLDKKTVAFVFDNLQEAVDLFDGRDEYGMIDNWENPLYKLCAFMLNKIEHNAYIDLVDGELFLSTIFNDISDHGSNDILLSLDNAIENNSTITEVDQDLLIAHKLKLLSKRIKRRAKLSTTKEVTN